ncbi:DMT family transporter [Mesorhizobium sp. M0222]|uniref:DMT family transporter n=1 Tax=Mesorhizobium sp. M0222 TaxID=2956921 RepID=UPI0033381781
MTIRGLGDPAARGAAMVLVATLAWSFAGLFTRSLSLDVWTTVSLRSLAAASVLLVIQCFKHRTATLHNLLGIGFVGWAAVLLSVVAQAATTASFFLTSVAHVTVIYATCPFVAALIARVWLQERISKTTLIAVVASIVGVVIVVSGSSETSTLSGDFVALLMTLSFSTTIVLSKARPTLRVLEATTIGAILTFVNLPALRLHRQNGSAESDAGLRLRFLEHDPRLLPVHRGRKASPCRHEWIDARNHSLAVLGVASVRRERR